MASNVPSTMKAAQLVEFNSKPGFKIVEVPTPKPGDNDVLVKMGAAGYCHTDHQVWEGVYGSPLPLVPSHEPAGTIVEVGKNVAAEGTWKIGQRVGVLLFKHQCGHCIRCEHGYDIRYCENKEMAGLTHDGGIAEYMVGDPKTMCRLPDEISFVQGAPLMCAGLTVWTGIQQSNPKSKEPIGVIGIGGLGTLAVQIAKALGHPVVAIDNRPEGRDLATLNDNPKLKADLIVDSTDPDAISKVKEATGKLGLSSLVVCTDDVAVNEWALKLMRPHGTVVALGVPATGYKFSAFDLIFTSVSVVGSLVGTAQEAQKMLDLVAKFGIKSHVTTIPLSRAGELPHLYSDPHLKGRLVVDLSI
ncbi:GroES-like protein [Polyplosphaeria fusca]|uniref:GroES-like protein n=1 Tax=Polyplosphaeria fusca TaxID=682080 RepID=A0A9P4QK23_9PLEO|nr:GroES-like protein [Polyplosphaeria fusca]